MLPEIIITCVIFLLSDGSLFCQCEGEPGPPSEQVVTVVEEVKKTKQEPIVAP